MNPARLAPLEAPFPPSVAPDLEAMMPPGVPPIALFRTLAHNPRVLSRIRHGNLLDRGSIDRRTRELIILRATARCGSEYEWGVHVAFFAERVGLGREEVDRTVLAPPGCADWDEADRDLVDLVDELHDEGRVPDDLWCRLAGRFAPDQLVELVVLVGFYHTIAFVTEAFRIEPEAGTPRFPC